MLLLLLYVCVLHLSSNVFLDTVCSIFFIEVLALQKTKIAFKKFLWNTEQYLKLLQNVGKHYIAWNWFMEDGFRFQGIYLLYEYFMQKQARSNGKRSYFTHSIVDHQWLSVSSNCGLYENLYFLLEYVVQLKQQQQKHWKRI